MADLTDPTSVAARSTASARGETETLSVAPVDPRAVRVRISDTSQDGDGPGLTVSPAGPVSAGDDGAGVRAQRHTVTVDGQPSDIVLRPFGSGRFHLTVNGAVTRAVLEPAVAGEGGARRREVLVDGFRFEVETESERLAALRERASRGRAVGARSGPLQVKAIIPGKVATVFVAPGDAVAAGEHLLVVEAMKMQNELRAPRDGTISHLNVAPGQNIDVGDVLLVID
jgi:biotin carboxyl carrier protein